MKEMTINEITQIMFKWLDMKYRTYKKLEHDGSIYLYYDGQEYADIRIDKNDERVYYSWEIYEEFSNIIFIDRSVFEICMLKWVGNTFKLKVSTSKLSRYFASFSLKLPFWIENP